MFTSRATPEQKNLEFNQAFKDGRDYNPATGAHVVKAEPAAFDGINEEAFEKSVAEANAIQERTQWEREEAERVAIQEAQERFDSLTPTEQRIETERRYFNLLKGAYEELAEAKEKLSNIETDDESAARLRAHNAVYGTFTAQAYKRVHSPGNTYYNDVILKDADLQENYVLKHVINFGTTKMLCYLKRGVTQQEVFDEELAKELAIIQRLDHKGRAEQAYVNAWLKVEGFNKQFMKALAEIKTADSFIAEFGKIPVPESVAKERKAKKKD
ncbi:hypothetical protein ACJJVG_08840 [Pseudocitrobacter faecalis]|uniref:hypothetical protein n=1 Tax=Pseudocitrobacter faecalis TaxID=1398493 RepID=UPI00389AB1BC